MTGAPSCLLLWQGGSHGGAAAMGRDIWGGGARRTVAPIGAREARGPREFKHKALREAQCGAVIVSATRVSSARPGTRRRRTSGRSFHTRRMGRGEPCNPPYICNGAASPC